MLTIFIVKCAIYYHKTHKNRLSKSALKKLPVRKYQKSDKYDTCKFLGSEGKDGSMVDYLIYSLKVQFV